ncbi:MAG: DUF4760 domain-containing protein [Balneolales bacterium]|nr:DUF4760 domain-containing protein [Balneolales bacterium]
MNSIVENIETISLLIAGLGLILNFIRLKANHDWNRRVEASKMIAEWNSETSKHRKAIEDIEPGIIDININSDKAEIKEITKTRAAEIYSSNDVKSPDRELRFHFIEILNYFEYVASAYDNKVADKKMIEESFMNTMIAWEELLHNFIVEYGKHRKSNSWKPFTDVVNIWKLKGKKTRKKTA